MKKMAGWLLIALVGMTVSVYAETIELVTYYPSSATTGDLHVTSLTVGTAYNGVTPPDGVAAIYDKLWIGQGYTNPDPDPAALRVVGYPGVLDKVLFLPGTGGTLAVGIGTADPQYLLHVMGNVPAEGEGVGRARIAVESTTAGIAGIHIGHLPVNAGAPTDRQWASIGYTDNLDVLKINNSNTFTDNHLAITNIGNVGIGTRAPNSRLDVQGSMSLGVTVVAASMALTDAHNVILTNGAGNITITLPAAATRTGRTYYIKKTDGDANTVMINAAGGVLIDGAASLVLYVQGDAVRVVTDGFNWFVISDELHPHAAKMSRRASQGVPGGSTRVDFDTVDFDVGGLADPAANRFVIVRTGLYTVSAYWLLPFPGTDGRVNVMINNTHQAQDIRSDGEGRSNPSVTDIFFLQTGDRLEMQMDNESAGASTNVASQHWPRMSVTEIRP